jgi:hypothetical protein
MGDGWGDYLDEEGLVQDIKKPLSKEWFTNQERSSV